MFSPRKKTNGIHSLLGHQLPSVQYKGADLASVDDVFVRFEKARVEEHWRPFGRHDVLLNLRNGSNRN